jgi:hypothetical protein
MNELAVSQGQPKQERELLLNETPFIVKYIHHDKTLLTISSDPKKPDAPWKGLIGKGMALAMEIKKFDIDLSSVIKPVHPDFAVKRDSLKELNERLVVNEFSGAFNELTSYTLTVLDLLESLYVVSNVEKLPKKVYSYKELYVKVEKVLSLIERIEVIRTDKASPSFYKYMSLVIKSSMLTTDFEETLKKLKQDLSVEIANKKLGYTIEKEITHPPTIKDRLQSKLQTDSNSNNIQEKITDFDKRISFDTDLIKNAMPKSKPTQSNHHQSTKYRYTQNNYRQNVRTLDNYKEWSRLEIYKENGLEEPQHISNVIVCNMRRIKSFYDNKEVIVFFTLHLKDENSQKALLKSVQSCLKMEQVCSNQCTKVKGYTDFVNKLDLIVNGKIFQDTSDEIKHVMSNMLLIETDFQCIVNCIPVLMTWS